MSPFAHPLFTVLTGIGFGIAAMSAEHHHVRRVLLPLAGLLLAMGMHATWNGSSNFGEFGFFAVYASFMVPAFALLTWLVIWTRQRELRTVRAELPAYAAAGWLSAPEPYVLSSMRARRIAREYAARHQGRPAARSVAEYEAYATSLAFLRHRGREGRAGADFVVRERELLDELWRRRDIARPALAYAARATAPVIPVVPVPPPWPAFGYIHIHTGNESHQGPYGAPARYPSYNISHDSSYNPYRRP